MGQNEGVPAETRSSVLGAASPTPKLTGVRPEEKSVAVPSGMSTWGKVVSVPHPPAGTAEKGGEDDAGGSYTLLWPGCP